MPYQQIDALIKTRVSNFITTEHTAQLAAQNFFNALGAQLFPQGIPATSPNTLYLMDWRNESWTEVQSTQDLTAIKGRILPFAVGVRFFHGTAVAATIILPVTLESQGGDAAFLLGSNTNGPVSSSGGSYSVVAAHAENLIGQAANGWQYDQRGVETITA